MQRLVILFTAALMIANVSVHAADSTIPCKSPPDAGASVAVREGTQVTTTQNRQDKTCTFSINGATATSPPPEEVLAALNVFRDPSLKFVKDTNSAAVAIATLMAAPSPVKEVPKDLIERMMRASDKLAQCLAEFFEKGGFPDLKWDGGIACKGIEPFKDPREKSAVLEKTGIAVAVPTLAITATWQSEQFTSVVYLPFVITRLPPLR